ncbi:hypothetical protein Gotri_026474, partial [Gossypium trilobum]|nr:hypothetical protein [Gossypium trilobum]
MIRHVRLCLLKEIDSRGRWVDDLNATVEQLYKEQ